MRITISQIILNNILLCYNVRTFNFSFTNIIAIMSNDNHHVPFVFCLPVFLLIVSVYCLCIEVEEVRRRQHCLMFSSAGSQAQTYFVNFDTLADYQRWHRQASKVSWRQRVCVTLCAWHNMCFLSAAVCLFALVPLGFCLNQSLTVGTTVAFCRLSLPIRNRLSECVWFAPQRKTLSGVWHWLNSVTLLTKFIFSTSIRGLFDLFLQRPLPVEVLF